LPVVDLNGVVTSFDYDEWGQLSLYGEGKVDDANIFATW
jgi:hypothetical protein